MVLYLETQSQSFVGRASRGVHVDKATGRNYVTSGTGRLHVLIPGGMSDYPHLSNLCEHKHSL